MSTATEETYTEEQIHEAARNLVDRAKGNATLAAQHKGKGYAIVSYPGAIDPLDRAAAEHLQEEGMEVIWSKGAFANSIMFPGHEIIRAR